MADLIETGSEPEHVIDEIAAFEFVSGGSMLRLYFAGKKHGNAELQCTALGSPEDLVRIAQRILDIASSMADALALRAMLDTSTAH